MKNKPMLNVYPDSIGGNLTGTVQLLAGPLKDAFGSVYILPSLYHSDLDRGFSVIDYDINEEIASAEDLEKLKEMGIQLKLDFVLNHASAQSPQFTDLVENGFASRYRDFFIDWNKFWAGHGEMTEEGYIRPREEDIKDMFFRKPGLPLLMVQFRDGGKAPYWNTFYQEYKDGRYLGQMDLNIRSDMVWEFYRDVLSKIASYGADTVRLDAFAYADKEVGARNFMNEPATWDILQKVADIAEPKGLTLLPEIHATYADGVYRQIADKGYPTYDFFLPGLILDGIENERSEYLVRWGNEIVSDGLKVVNMLGCHDGIPLLDLKGLLPEEDIDRLIDLLVSRGGLVKNLDGQQKMYYQVNCAYYSALGADPQKMLLARAIQLFMPARPQVWYLDLFAGENDLEAVRKAGPGGHKEINRTDLSTDDVEKALRNEMVREQIRMLRMRTAHPAFDEDAQVTISGGPSSLSITWKHGESTASLEADLTTKEYVIHE